MRVIVAFAFAALLALGPLQAHAQSDLLFASGFETGNATIGPSGGVVPGPDGVRLVVEEGALAQPVAFRIAADAAGAPPVPAGIALAGSVYAITPHGTGFDATAMVELPVPPGGEPVFLMKAEVGGTRWSVVAQAGVPGPVLRAGVETLSWFALGRCTPVLPAGACPSGHSLSLELLDGSSIVIPIDAQNPQQPVLTVTEPTLLTFRLRWNRPALLTARTDTLDTGSAINGAVLARSAGFAFGPGAPRGEQVTGNVDRIFGVTVTPAQIAGAADADRFGRVRNIWASASYVNVDPVFGQA
ncbi:MAG: hypothetical protein LW860_15830 [Xanthomonadaceae bacterium]|jgi:hypothetical protein|nr:hypothetical protein [Xanthomonadaceae bacterium]